MHPRKAHPTCWTEAGHCCQKPSGQPCIEDGCNEPAGTIWGPHWCPDHDAERIDLVMNQMLDPEPPDSE